MFDCLAVCGSIPRRNDRLSAKCYRSHLIDLLSLRAQDTIQRTCWEIAVYKPVLMHNLVGDDEEMICQFVARLFERDFWILTEDLRNLFLHLLHSFNHRFPKHFLFANFRCIQCGRCCDHERNVDTEDIQRWLVERRIDILAHVDCLDKHACCAEVVNYAPCHSCSRATKEIVAFTSTGRCPFVRKVSGKPYYKCRIHTTKPEECSGYLCEKSIPVANLNWNGIDELISMIGLQKYGVLASQVRKEERN